jgi:hypothetical protein
VHSSLDSAYFAFAAVAKKKNPKQDTRLGVWSLLPHLGFWVGGTMSGMGCRPTWPN